MTTLEEQIAEAEAPEPDEEEEAVEAEEDEPEEPEEPEREAESAEPPEQPALTAIGPDEIRKAENAISAQRKKLGGILGDDYVAHDCLVCSGLGFVPELPPAGVMFVAVESEDGMTLLAQEPEPQRNLVEAKDKTGCDWCAGEGFVLSGSKNPNAAVVPCSKCSGNGWVMVPVEQSSPPVAAAVTTGETPASPANTEGLGHDAWGRPAGHQHWGVPPAMIQG
jgi:hypothetical protein